MKINIKATGIDLTPTISNYVEDKIGSLDKYISNTDGVLAHVEVGRVTEHHRQGEIHKAEVHITGAGLDVYAVTQEEDLLAAIDIVKDEVAKELRRTKGRQFAMMKKGGQVVKNMMKGFSEGPKKSYEWSLEKLRRFRKQK